MLKFWLVVSQGKFCLYEKTVKKKSLQRFVSLHYFRGTNHSISKFLNDFDRFVVVANALTDDSTLVGSKNGIYCCTLKTVSIVLAVLGCNARSRLVITNFC
jgi:hypothetical protein